jgi:murein L,D-transpeptidase YcbB/YkuD
MSAWLLGLITVGGLMAQTPRPVMDVFQAAGEALANQDADTFLDQFDPEMPGFAKLRDEIQELAAIQEASSTVDVVTDVGDDKKRILSLDWVLRIGSDRPRRQIVKCTVEKQGKRWKITALDPVEFFKK